MARGNKYVAVYDISDDRERNRVSHVLEGYGFRVQESAFECMLTKALREKLRLALEQLELKTGFINIYRVSETAKTITVGKAPESRPDDGFAFVV